MDRILHGAAVRDVTVRLRHADWPSDRILSYTGTELPQLDGRTLPVVTISDLTDQYEAIQARLESEEQLRLANEAAGIGTYDIDFAVGHIRYSPEMCALLGVDGSTEHPLDESLGFVHPDDAEDFDRLFATASVHGMVNVWDVESGSQFAAIHQVLDETPVPDHRCPTAARCRHATP